MTRHYSSNTPSDIADMMRRAPWVVPAKEQPAQVPLPAHVPYYEPETDKPAGERSPHNFS